ncbi:MAG: carboxypeptidase regulatory-like domain-containing protein [archaeon]
MGLSDAYYAIEDKWYGFIDSVSEKVPAFGKFIDSLEAKGVPSFPAFIALVIIVIALFAYFFVIAANSSLAINITDSSGAVVEGATVVVLQSSQEKSSLVTDSDGKVVFYLPNGEYSIKVDKDNYSSTAKSIVLSGNGSEDLILTSSDVTLTKSVYLKTATGAVVEGSGSVIYKCKGSSEELVATYTNGKFDARVGADCAEVEVISVQNYNIVNSTASFAGNSSATVERQIVLMGSVSVTLKNSDTNAAPPAGLRVKLIPNDGTTAIEELSTGTSIVTFESVPIKSYYVIVTDSSGAYASYDGTKNEGEKEVKQGQITSFNVNLLKAISSSITVNVKDAANSTPIKGAVITIASLTNSNDTQTLVTDVTGQKVFGVADGSAYTISVEQDNYISGVTKQASAGDTVEIDLVRANESNSNSILVKVMDPKGSPIDNARVILKKSDTAGTTVAEKTTGASGTAEFFNLDITQTYFATVSKEGFGSQNSTSVQAQPRTQRVLEVTFDIGEGQINVKVLDTDKNPLSGASVKAINYYTSQQEGSSILTSTEGLANFTIRADKKVYFVVETTGYQKYFTATTQAKANATIDKTVILQKPTAKISAVLIGVYSGAAEVSATASAATTSAASTVSQGNYTVRAVVLVPKGSFTEAGLHLRTGKETQNVTNLMEEDGLNLSSVESSGRLTRGTTYSPPQGMDADKKNTTTGNAKWINSVWKNPQEGTYEVEAQVNVIEENPNVPLNLYYRGWAKGQTTLRDPAGDATGQELFWPAKNRVLTSGASNLCTQNFCKSYILETLTGSDAGQKRFVSGTMLAKKGQSFSLTADITNYSGRAMSGSVLNVASESLDINFVSVNGVIQSDFTAISLGAIGIDAPVKVMVMFNTTSSGSSALKFTINSAKGTELSDAVNFNVAVNKKFSLDILPKIVVPLIDNTMYFTITDGNTPVNGARISIKSGNDLLATVPTNSEGIASYLLAEPKIGDVLLITAQKEGFDKTEVTINVDSALLTITPPSISETLKVGDATGFDTQILIENDTAKDVKINSVQINGGMKSYLDVLFSDTIAGTVIVQGKDRNYFLSMKLNSAAKKIVEPKDLTGTIVFNTTVVGTNQSYITSLPVTIRLSMPGFLDNSKCLQITPTSVEFVAADSSVSKTITIKNNCEAESNPIILHNIEAKLSEELKIGSISITGTGFNNSQLSAKYQKVADVFDNGAETELTLNYSPNPAVASGTNAVTVTFAGYNILNDKSTEKVEVSVKATATTNSLSKCVEIRKPVGGLVIDVAPWDMGYARIQAASSLSTLNGYQGIVNRNSPYNNPYMSNMGMAGAGVSGYGSAGYGLAGYGNTGLGSASNLGGTAAYSQNSFIIKNGCTSDVEIQLEPDSRLTVDEQKFTISADSDKTVVVSPGYVLGKYNIKVNAKLSGSLDTKKSLGDVSVIVRRLGDLDKDCIKTNVTNINLNSFIYKPQKYSVYNYCYDTGTALTRDSSLATVDCSAPQNEYDIGYFQAGAQGAYNQQFPLTAQDPTYQAYTRQAAVQTSGLTANGCPRNSCSLITGTQVRYRTIEDGANGSVERVDFEVMPSTKYIPQMKLFNNQTNSYGLFQNLSSIRTWGTETAARTDVYGNLNISYTNNYGSGQCMQFPITITDTWRMLESIDSAINWGDPTATPKECMEPDALNIKAQWASTNGVVPDNEFKLNNNNSYIYFPEPPALRIGPAPSTQSSSYPSYNYQYYWNQANAQQTSPQKSGGSSSASKNCGLLDSIDIQTQITPAEAGGAKITITDRGSGSILNNTRGSNLAVEIDKTNMTANCVNIDKKPITTKVTRSITMQSQTVTWMLSVIFTKKGYVYKGNPNECMKVGDQIAADCTEALKKKLLDGKIAKGNTSAIQGVIDALKKERPECANYVDLPIANSLINEIQIVTSATKGCQFIVADYSYDKISKAGYAKGAPFNDLVDCSKSFCNNQMLQAFLLKRFAEIKVETSKLTNNLTDSKDLYISKLYKQAIGPDVNICDQGSLSFFLNSSRTLKFSDFEITKEMRTVGSSDLNASIATMGPNAIKDLMGVIENIKTKFPQSDYNSILLEIDSNATYDDQIIQVLHAIKVENKLYLPLDNYYYLLKDATDLVAIQVPLRNPYTAAPGTSINYSGAKYCGFNGTIGVEAFRWMSYNSRLVKGIYDKANITPQEIEKIYAANPNLNKIHQLALFNTKLKNTLTEKGVAINSAVGDDLLLTNISDTSQAFVPGIFDNVPADISGLSIKILRNGSDIPMLGMGGYSAELDFSYANKDETTATLKLGDLNSNVGGLRMKSNPMLESGFSFENVPIDSVIVNPTQGKVLDFVDNKLYFYKSVPVKLTVQLNGNETALNYRLQSSPSAILPNYIDWYKAGTKIGTGKWNGNAYTFNVAPQTSAQTIKGIFYYPGGLNQLGTENPLFFLQGAFGGTVFPTVSTIVYNSLGNINPVAIPTTPLQSPLQLPQEVRPDLLSLNDMLSELKEASGNACPVDNGVIWNEKNIIGTN